MALVLHDPPSRVHQDDFSPAKGNALQACVASLLGHQSLQDVPNFIALECGYEQGIRDYFHETTKYAVVKKSCRDVSSENENGKLCILRGKSPRGDFGHVVVARVVDNNTFEMIHDPHPDGTFLDPSEEYGWYMMFEEQS